MMGKFKEMLLEKMREQGEPKDLSHKASAAKDLSDTLAKEIAGKMGGLKKVTVAADSKEGLVEGLDKAEDMLEGESEEKDEEMEGEEMESEESPESMDAEIADLEKKLQELKSKRK
jgi:predicted RNase H-like nuclease (RuvC/YqgF family)